MGSKMWQRGRTRSRWMEYHDISKQARSLKFNCGNGDLKTEFRSSSEDINPTTSTSIKPHLQALNHIYKKSGLDVLHFSFLFLTTTRGKICAKRCNAFFGLTTKSTIYLSHFVVTSHFRVNCYKAK